MADLPRTPALDDRALDQNVERLRDAAAFFIDLVRRVVRTELLAGAHPSDAMVKGIMMLEAWEEGTDVPAAQPPELYAAEVEAAIVILIERLGAAAAWDWLLRPNDRLYSQTPLRAIVGHRVREVRTLAAAIPEHEPPQPASGEQHGDQP